MKKNDQKLFPYKPFFAPKNPNDDGIRINLPIEDDYVYLPHPRFVSKAKMWRKGVRYNGFVTINDQHIGFNTINAWNMYLKKPYDDPAGTDRFATDLISTLSIKNGSYKWHNAFFIITRFEEEIILVCKKDQEFSEIIKEYQKPNE